MDDLCCHVATALHQARERRDLQHAPAWYGTLGPHSQVGSQSKDGVSQVKEGYAVVTWTDADFPSKPTMCILPGKHICQYAGCIVGALLR